MLNWKRSRHGDDYLYELNRDDFAVSPAREVLARRFMSNLLEDDHLYIVIGSDSGLLIEHVLAHRGPSARSRYVFVEPAEVVEALGLASREFPAWMQVCQPAGLDECRPAARFTQFCFRGRVRVVKSMAAEADHARIYAAVSEAVLISQTKSEHEVLVSLGTKVFVERHILNAPDCFRPASDVYPAFAGRRVLIIAAGPSLDLHLDWIAANRDRFVIIAVARVGEALANHGITPDYYSIIDPHPAMLNVARDALAQSDAVPLLTSYHAHGDVVANWRSEVFYCGPRLPWESSLNVPAPGVFGPTVTHFSLLIAIRSQPAEVYLAGMDLCFGGTGLKSHCSGSGENKAGPALGRLGVQQVETYDGGVADADVNLLMSVDSAAMLAGLAKSLGVPLFNLSSGAAKVEGIDYRNPADVVFADEPPALVEVAACDIEAYRRYLKALKREIIDVGNDLEKLKADLAKRQRRIAQLVDSQGRVLSKHVKVIDAIDKRADRFGRGIDEFVKHWGVGYFMSNYDDKEVEEITAEDLTRFYRTYYDAYLQSIDEIQKVLGRARSKCERRLNELSATDCAALASEWVESGEFLRIEKSAIAARLASCADYEANRSALRARFDDMYAELARADERRCERSVNQRNVLATAYYLFDRKRSDALRELADFVRGKKDGSFAATLLPLLEGLLAELEGTPQLALERFEEVAVGEDKSLVELALMQIHDLARGLEDYPLCIQALDCLEAFSSTYLKYNAEMLIQVGDVRGALGKLADYHEEFPEDVDNLVRIIDIYHHTGNTAQANALLEQVAAAHPAHAGVRRMQQLLAGGG